MTSRDWTVVLLVVLGAVILLPLLGMTFWGGGMMGPGHMMGRGMWGWGPGAGFAGGFSGFGLLVLVLVIVGVALIVSGLTRKDGGSDDALQILRARLARGEITPEQFEELKKALG